MPKGLALKPQLWEKVERGVDDSTPIRTAAVLTCVAAPLPADAFRPAFCDRQARIYFSRLDIQTEVVVEGFGNGLQLGPDSMRNMAALLYTPRERQYDRILAEKRIMPRRLNQELKDNRYG